MNFRSITMGLAVAFVVLLTDGAEQLYPDFDVERSTAGALLEVIEKAAKQGATRVRFSSGEWNWYDLGRLDLPKKEKYVSKEFPAKSRELASRIETWVEENGVKGVVVLLDPEIPAKWFFVVEVTLRKKGVVYWVASEKNLAKGGVRLQETDGNVRTVKAAQP